MSLQERPAEAYPRREELLFEVAITVNTTKHENAVLEVVTEAERIYRMYPNSSLSLDEIEGEMIRLGVACRVAMEFI